MAHKQETTSHLGSCPTNTTGLQGDCSCDKEAAHYLGLAKWSFGLFLFEFVGGIFSNSLALVSDSLHVLLDGTENILSVIISKLARKQGDEERLRRVGGKISAALLLVAGGLFAHEGYERILSPHEVEWYMTIIALIGLGVNWWQMHLHHHVADEHRNHTHFWQNWHLMSDIAASSAVVIGGAVMLVADGWYWIDGILSLVIGIVIMSLVGARLFGFKAHAHSGAHAKHQNDSECNHCD